MGYKRDKDGDLVFLTDNPVIVNSVIPQPTIMCMQRKAEKKNVTEDDLARSNVDSFGDDIGRTTNWITSMFDVQAQFHRTARNTRYWITGSGAVNFSNRMRLTSVAPHGDMRC